MKCLWQLLAWGGALAVAGVAGCAESAAPVSPRQEEVPANIVVPSLRGPEAGKFTVDAFGNRKIITDDPVGGDDGSGYCDGCDSGSGGYSTGTSANSPQIDPVFTEAHFDGDKFVGHAEMTYNFADQVSQEMTLTTARDDGSTLGSQKFATGNTWPIATVFAMTLVTDGSIFAPSCGARGQGVTTHKAALHLFGATYLNKLGSESAMMYQPRCTSTNTSGSGETTDATSGGQIRVCLVEDHYSSTGEYIDTETIYCYSTYAT